MKNYSYHKWRIWTILAFSFIMALFHRSALGAISGDVSLELGLTASELSGLASITFYTYALMQIPAGILLDSFGYRKMSCYGMFATGLGSILFGATSSLALIYISRLLIGLGTSVIFISILKMQQVWFSREQFTKASGILSFIGNIGGIIATFPLAILVLCMGWRSAMLLMGIICLVVSIVIFFCTKNSPTEYGLISQGMNLSTQRPPIFKSLRILLTQGTTWRNFFILFTSVGCTTTLTGLWGINYLLHVYKLSNAEASFYVAFIIYGLVIGSLCVNRITSLFKDNLAMYPRIACILMSLCWFYILIIAKGQPPLSVLSLLFFIIGFLAMSHIIAFTDITNHCDANVSGLASSIVNSGEFLGSSLIALIIGGSLDLSWKGALANGVRIYDTSSYTFAFYIFLMMSLLGIATSFIGQRKSKAN